MEGVARKLKGGRKGNISSPYSAVASWNNLPTATVHQPKMAKNSEINNGKRQGSDSYDSH
jgi:hypothetical protein